MNDCKLMLSIAPDKATQENAATSEESANSSEELNAQAANLGSMISELTKAVTGNSQKEGFATARDDKQYLKVIPTKNLSLANDGSCTESDSQWRELI